MAWKRIAFLAGVGSLSILVIASAWLLDDELADRGCYATSNSYYGCRAAALGETQTQRGTRNMQEIDSAPTDGSAIKVARFAGGKMLWRYRARWTQNSWRLVGNEDVPLLPTHWEPIEPKKEAKPCAKR